MSEISESTPEQTAQRRLRVLHTLATTALGAESRQACLELAARALAGAALDLAFVLFYELDEACSEARLTAQTGLTDDACARVELLDVSSNQSWPFQAALALGRPELVHDVQARFPGLAVGPAAQRIASVYMLPISPSHQLRVVAVVGMPPCSSREEAATQPFFELLTAGLTSALAMTLLRMHERSPLAASELVERSSIALAKERDGLADKLADANKELDAFSYSVSHDLRAPLRAIDGFSKALLSDYAGQLDDQGRRYLERVRSGTQRMADLIDDLVSLSRITRAPMVSELVDITHISRRVLAELGAADPTRTVETHVTDGLSARGDSRLVAVMFENLLGNAWKFTSKRPDARIEVGSEQREAKTVFFVRDNGAGFDMTYAKRLFTPFQRLHSTAEFQGTGIGLATVQRVINRHGGKVWADSTPDRGATFYFTLAEVA
ncbi:MAG TPA: ATP-binding protein [Polyangiales bacterium]|nr:ATP-binding protein [Polyangiales bacterium]